MEIAIITFYHPYFGSLLSINRTQITGTGQPRKWLSSRFSPHVPMS